MSVALKIFGIILGGIMLLGSIFDWDLVVNGRREKIVRPLIGRTAIRIFYGITGLILIVCITLLFNVI